VKRILIYVLPLLIANASLSQKGANNWYFGAKAAITFNQGSPVALYNSAMHATEGVSSISDRNGNLLFYSDGWHIWNRNHQVMQNGFNIGSNADAAQSGLIVPYPGHDSLYHFFPFNNWVVIFFIR
jgi:hypothetical protein